MSSPFFFESSDDESSRLGEIKSSNDVKESDDLPEVTVEETSEEHKRVERIRTLLMGVPPPPAVTVSQYNASEILHLFQENSFAFDWPCKNTNSVETNEIIESILNKPWPDVRDHHWFNVSYNRGSVSEELALLSVKYQERYISNETSSSVNSFFSKSPMRTASAKKRARRLGAWGHSPGRRLSHLARRRHTFSSANLQQNATKAQNDKKKMILVDRKKANKRGRNSVTKCSGNGKTLKPASCVSTKRALFQSPENGKRNGSVLPEERSAERVVRSKRALWPDKPETDKENGTRSGKRYAASPESVASVKKKCLRSLSFSDDKRTQLRQTSEHTPVLVPEDLSQLHRKKLLWAVSNALRKEGIGMEHSLSKLCMSELFRICKELWLKKCVSEERNGSTSDRMLDLANKFAGEVVRRVKTKLDMLKKSDDSSNKPNTDTSVKKQSLTNKISAKRDKTLGVNNLVCDKLSHENLKDSSPVVNRCDNVKISDIDNAKNTSVTKLSPIKDNIPGKDEFDTSETQTNLSSSTKLINNLDCESKNDCNNLLSSIKDNENTMPPLSPLSVSDINEDTRCSSSCDMDLHKIINSLNSDNECD